MGKRGKKGRGWGVKYISGGYYVVTSEFSLIKTWAKKARLSAMLEAGLIHKTKPNFLNTDTSTSNWRSIGRWDTDKRTPKLLAFIAAQPPEFSDEVEREIEMLKRRREQRQRLKAAQ